MNLKTYLDRCASLVNEAGPRFIKNLKDSSPRLIESMVYSYSAGGKRLRPAFMFAAYELFGGKAEDIVPAACALEMIQTYSLIHDDLPCMDNDDLRRGKPTCHKVYGEAGALLAGDALLTDAFTVLLTSGYPGAVKGRLADAGGIMALHSGASGMISGQSIDLQSEGFFEREDMTNDAKKEEGLRRLAYLQLHKTADLFMAAVKMGAVLAGASSENIKNLEGFGRETGLCFQIADDILDVTADRKKLAKSSHDAEKGKLTYVTLLGLEEARRHEAGHLQAALGFLDKVEGRKEIKILLGDLAEYFVKRDY